MKEQEVFFHRKEREEFVDHEIFISSLIHEKGGIEGVQPPLTKWVSPTGEIYIVGKRYSANLQEKIAAKTLTSSEKRNIALRITDGLSALHRMHISHGDIKPENILLDDEGKADITDFEGAITTDLTTIEKASWNWRRIGGRTPGFVRQEDVLEQMAQEDLIFSIIDKMKKSQDPETRNLLEKALQKYEELTQKTDLYALTKTLQALLKD